jgi:hypothetical protein
MMCWWLLAILTFGPLLWYGVRGGIMLLAMWMDKRDRK